MDYKEFREIITPHILIPTPEQKKKLILGKNTIHFALSLTGENFTYMGEQMKDFVDVVYIATERGAVLGYDYMVGCQIQHDEKESKIIVVFHALDEIISDEDFPVKYPRLDER